MKKIWLIFLLVNLTMISCAFEDPYFITIEAYGYNNTRIKIDGNFAQISEIGYGVAFKQKELDSVQLSKFYVKLKYSKNTPKEKISDIENELRKANVLNVKYYEVEHRKNYY